MRTSNKIKINPLYKWFPNVSEDVYLLLNFPNGLLAMSKDSKILLDFEQSSHSSFLVLRAYYTLGMVMCPTYLVFITTARSEALLLGIL